MMRARMDTEGGRLARFAALGALLLFLCWQRVQATRLGYQVEAARREARAARGRVADLKLELDGRLSPAALAARAGSRLGMVPADPAGLRTLAARPAVGPGFLPRLWARSLSAFPARS